MQVFWGCWISHSLLLRELPNNVAYSCNFFLLLRYLYNFSQACYANEYCYWRCFWRYATDFGVGSVNNTVGPEALILFLIIFCWTPPHFWALALYRRNDYAKVGIPMLPVTHGESFTLLQIVLYTIILIIVTMAPFSLGMSGLIYLICATILNAVFLYYVIMLFKNYSDKLSMKTFRYSIIYLSLIFSAMLIDHYFKFTLY